MSTKARLLDAAEQLIAAHGVDDVTVAEITQAAEQRNAAAVHYHFGGRDGLLDAILERHHGQIDALRFGTLDARVDEWDLRSLVALIVEPLLTRLDDDAGRAFLRIQADRFLRSGNVVTTNLAESMDRIAQLLTEHIPTAEPAVSAERARLATTMITVRLGQEASGTATCARDTLRRVLTDAVTAVFLVDP